MRLEFQVKDEKFFIHNLMNKVKRYIEACHTCLKTKPKYKKNRPVYGRIPVDYTPMQDLSIDDAPSIWWLSFAISNNL